MRLGCCGGIDQAELIKNAGFDFLEVNVQAVLCGQDDDATWARSAPDPAKLPLPIEAANCLVPGALPIIGPARDFDALTHYMRNVAARASKLGMRILVFGSGGARQKPEGFSAAHAAGQLTEFTRMAGEMCGEQGVTLVIEHLHRGETNTINRLSQARSLCDEVNHPAVAMLVDSYHYGLEKETDEDLLDLGDRIAHVHVAEVIDRIQPGGHGGDQGENRDKGKAFDFEYFFSLLHKMGYDQRVSIEAGWKPALEEVGAKTAQLLRDTWEQAGSDADREGDL